LRTLSKIAVGKSTRSLRRSLASSLTLARVVCRGVIVVDQHTGRR
jgi:hypothetical protein